MSRDTTSALTVSASKARPEMKFPGYATTPDEIRLDFSPVYGALLTSPANLSPGGRHDRYPLSANIQQEGALFAAESLI